MKITNVIVSLSVVTLASATGAFALGTDDDPATQSQQSPPAQSPAYAAPRAQPPATGGPGGGLPVHSQPAGAVSSEDVLKQVQQALALAGDSADSALATAGRAASAALANADAAIIHGDHAGKEIWKTQLAPKFAAFQNDFEWTDRGPSRDAAAVIVTRPMASQNAVDWQEDLKVMDQLLRDEIARIDGNSIHQAMGLPLFRPSRSAEPMYLEDYGAVFSYRASFPLAGAEAAAPKNGENPNHPSESAWDRAKAELEAPSDLETEGAAARGNAQRLQSQLIGAILQILPEAKNIRNLKETESVIVTVAGSTDAGKPARLTIKAKKADIDRAASGKLTPEEFKARVVWTMSP